ncbi:hypothetical protein [Nocardioides endophyticus]
MPGEVAVLLVHEHDWHLREVRHEEGNAIEEYACTGCPAVTFR